MQKISIMIKESKIYEKTQDPTCPCPLPPMSHPHSTPPLKLHLQEQVDGLMAGACQFDLFKYRIKILFILLTGVFVVCGGFWHSLNSALEANASVGVVFPLYEFPFCLLFSLSLCSSLSTPLPLSTSVNCVSPPGPP